MMKKQLLSVFFSFLVLTSFAYAPQDTIKTKAKPILIAGKIIDQKTGEPIPFVNIAIVGSFMGTITNLEGFFELKIPDALKDNEVTISAVGYKQIILPIPENAGKTDLHLKLIPENYQLSDVQVSAKSLAVYRYLKNAAANQKDNYYQEPLHYDVYYRSEIFNNDSLKRQREAAVRIYDGAGYRRGTAHDVYKNRGYKFLQVRRSFDLTSLESGSTNLDDLLEMDIVRVSGNVLDIKYIDFYELELDRITQYDNDSVWVINYVCKHPSLTTTGDNYATSYEGKLYVNIKDFAVVKNETTVEASNYSSLGRSFYVNEAKQAWKPESVKYNFSVIYKKYDDKYYLSYINYNRYHTLKNKQSGATKTETTKTELMVNKIEKENPEVIRKRAYYENIPFDKNFWDNYNIILDKK